MTASPEFRSIRQISSVAKLSSADFTISEVLTVSSTALSDIPLFISREVRLHANAESIRALLPLPIPASVYGLILMLLTLLTGLIKPEQISTVADFFLSIMPVLFIAPTVALITQPEHLAVMGVLRPGDVLLSATGKPYDTMEEVIGISGKAAQAVGRQEAKRREGKKHE